MEHPYKQFEGSVLWKSIDHAINRLSVNSDIIEQTRREYIVGYICSELSKELFNSPETDETK